MKVLFVGRFQPFHNGHLHAIREISKGNRIMIVIAGPKKKDSKNPFSFSEREMMIRKALDREDIKYDVSRIEDVHDDGRWGEKVKDAGEFDVAYSRNPWTIRCLEKAGIRVEIHDFYDRWKNCGREIRKRILRGKDWKDLVPPEVYEYVRQIKGEKRIKNYAGSRPD